MEEQAIITMSEYKRLKRLDDDKPRITVRYLSSCSYFYDSKDGSTVDFDLDESIRDLTKENKRLCDRVNIIELKLSLYENMTLFERVFQWNKS